jgi:hypothetical protein
MEKISEPKRRSDSITTDIPTKPLLLSSMVNKEWNRMWSLPIDIQLIIFNYNTELDIAAVHQSSTKSRYGIERYWVQARNITMMSEHPSFLNIMGHYQRVRSIIIPHQYSCYEPPLDALSSLITRNTASITSFDSPFIYVPPSILNQLSLCSSLTSLSVPEPLSGIDPEWDDVITDLVRSCSLLTDLRLHARRSFMTPRFMQFGELSPHSHIRT